MSKRLWVIAYDIADDATRLRVDKYLQKWGDRVQYSVFEAFLTAREAQGIRAAIAPWLCAESDSLRLYPLCVWCQDRHVILGQGRRSEDPCIIVL